MVGVAGKSKACKDCKTRRVKCGFERPGCVRCTKAHISCSGYDQKVFFVNRTLADPTVSAPIVLSRAPAKRPRLTLIQEELENLIEWSSACPASPSPFRLAAFDLLQKLYLPQPGVTDKESNSGNPFSWIRAVCELEDACPVLDRALIAFCTAQVYVTQTGSVTHAQSVERYHTALELLSSVLTLEGDDRLDYLLACIVVLSTCELFICPTDDGWRAHVKGIADVLRLRKDSLRIPPRIWASLCSRLRVICVLSQLTRREQGPLTRVQWAKLLPDHLDTEPLDQLMNIACELPDTLEQAAKILAREQINDHETITAVIIALWNILEDINISQAQFCAISQAPPYTAVPSKLTNPSDAIHETKLFPFALRFRSLQVASYFVIAWAIRLQVLATLLSLGQEEHTAEVLVPSQFSELHDSFGSIRSEAEKLARYLCQSIEYCHGTEMGTVGPQTMLFSQWIMHYFFARFGTKRELQWCQNIRNMNGVGARCGIKMMLFGSTTSTTGVD